MFNILVIKLNTSGEIIVSFLDNRLLKFLTLTLNNVTRTKNERTTVTFGHCYIRRPFPFRLVSDKFGAPKIEGIKHDPKMPVFIF
jgi:hypothetical protein